MQLNKQTSMQLGGKLALAAAALLQLPQGAEAADVTAPLSLDSRLMYYSETDRVSAFEAVLKGMYRMENEGVISGKVVFDALTGSSPNGAIPTNSVQTFTSPSGNASYDINPGEAALDPSFHDTRVALDLNYSAPLAKDLIGNIGISGSTEYDYLSLGITAGLSYDVFDKNATISTQVSFYNDTISAVGGTPKGLEFIPAYPGQKQTTGTSDDKQIIDVLVGWTQILTPKSLWKTNLVIGQESGYLSDPYKLLSVTDPVTGELVADPNQRYVSEKRPDSRFRVAWYTGYQQQFGEDVLRASYRFYNDDWGIQSHTFDLWYRWQAHPHHFLEPHIRTYLQGAADFYNTSLVQSEASGAGKLNEASADARLADMMAYTVGLTYGYELNDSQQLRISGEYYLQQADASRSIGVQNNQTLIEDLTAVSFRLGYQISW